MANTLECLDRQRDRLVGKLWLVLRDISDIRGPGDWTDEDRRLWGCVTHHSAVQSCLDQMRAEG